MTVFITQGRYTKEACAGFIAKPEDRSIAVRKLIEAGGGRLLAAYITLGEYDFLIITDFPDEEALLSRLIPGVASGALADLRTVVALDGPASLRAMEKSRAIAYQKPGNA